MRARFAGAPTAMRGASSPKIAAGPAERRSSSVSSVSRPGSDEIRVERRERGLEPDHPEGRRLERHVLLLARVRGMVGGDRRDRAVAQRLEQRLAVGLGAERRVHLHVRVERAHRLVGEAEMVRRHLAGRGDARPRAPARVLDGLRGPRGASGGSAGPPRRARGRGRPSRSRRARARGRGRARRRRGRRARGRRG